MVRIARTLDCSEAFLNRERRNLGLDHARDALVRLLVGGTGAVEAGLDRLDLRRRDDPLQKAELIVEAAPWVSATN